MLAIGDRKINLRIFFFLFCIAGGVVLFWSFSTSPLYPKYWGSDSAQFQTVGKAWAEGRIPYLEIFDHKGPIIFWVNMLGYKCFGRYGVVLCQIVFLFFTLLGIYKITAYGSERKIIRWGSLALTVVSLLKVYSNGNMCEEYCLPFLMFSAYGQYLYFKHTNQDHNVWWGFFYGVTVSIAILTRATNAIPVLCGIIVIIFMLIKTKQYYNILKNGVSFLLGGGYDIRHIFNLFYDKWRIWRFFIWNYNL